ncbi:MAG: amidohydrolase family protein [Pseudomonadota bacterium]
MTDWLDRTVEEALEPALPICDPHHHLWDHPNHRYLLEELLSDTGSGHNVVSTVFVECMSEYDDDGPEAVRPVGETRFVHDIAEQCAAAGHTTNVAAAIVSFADLTLGDAVTPVLEAHVGASSRFRGIRHAAGWDASESIRNSHTHPSAGLYADRAFRMGFQRLGELGLSFDAWLYHPQIDDVTALAHAFPDVTIILDHVGGPLGIGPYTEKQAEIFPLWRRSIDDLARCENVFVKLGGLAMKLNGFDWHKQPAPPSSAALADANRSYYLHCIDAFGPHRCMFESNFPVDKVSTSYTVLWNAFKRITSDFSADDRSALFRDSAHRAYRI